jgi:hypothetical protein
MKKVPFGNTGDILHFVRLSTMSMACAAERLTNQSSPSNTITSLVWTSFPGMNANFPKGI